MLRKLDNTKTQLETAKKEAARPFAKEQELTEKSQKLAQLNALLSMDEKEPTEHKAIEVSETVKDSTGGERRSVIEKLSRYKSETSSKSINQELSHTNQSTGCRDLIPKH
jgi:histidyl-tRNA synthetase